MSDANTLQQEWAAVQAAPHLHILVALAVIAIVWGAFRLLWGKRIGDRDSTIQNLQSTLGLVRQQLDALREKTARLEQQAEEQSRLIRIDAPREQLAANSASALTTVHEIASDIRDTSHSVGGTIIAAPPAWLPGHEPSEEKLLREATRTRKLK